jgi:glucose-6-phosphate isomerase, archaeal
MGFAASAPIRLSIEPRTGAMVGSTGAKQTRLRDLAGLYADRAAFERLAAGRGGDIAYEVQEFRPGRVAPQELVFGTSTLQPGSVGEEFFMTRGHIHIRADRPEIYACQSGRGVLHMEAPDGATNPVEIEPGSIVYVPAYWVHRSVNIGDKPFITLFCYPADAGQDYGIIERSQGMRTLIVRDGSGWREIENPRYRARSPAEQRRYCEDAAA